MQESTVIQYLADTGKGGNDPVTFGDLLQLIARQKAADDAAAAAAAQPVPAE